jgi:hypothetical protein
VQDNFFYIHQQPLLIHIQEFGAEKFDTFVSKQCVWFSDLFHGAVFHDTDFNFFYNMTVNTFTCGAL